MSYHQMQVGRVLVDVRYTYTDGDIQIQSAHIGPTDVTSIVDLLGVMDELYAIEEPMPTTWQERAADDAGVRLWGPL